MHQDIFFIFFILTAWRGRYSIASRYFFLTAWRGRYSIASRYIFFFTFFFRSA